MNAPRGPRKPHILTEAPCAAGSPAKVVVRIMYPHAMPTSTPVICMAMCAGVQNESRPMDMCQEMSHGPPIAPETMPANMHQMVHGIDVVGAVVRSATRTWTGTWRGTGCDMR